MSHIDRALQKTTSSLTSSTQWITAQTSATIDKAVTPEQRRELAKRTQSFVNTNPRLAAFFATNLVLSGIPVLIYLTFSISTFVFSVLTGLAIGLASALAFTATSVGVATFVLLPTLFLTTTAAVFLFAWGLAGFTILQWASSRSQGTRASGRVKGSASAPKSIAPNDKSSKEVGVHENGVRFSESKQSEIPFDFRSEKELKPKTSSTTAHGTGTALPSDLKLTEPVAPVKQQHSSQSIQVPTTGTTGMVAS